MFGLVETRLISDPWTPLEAGSLAAKGGEVRGFV
jgi:hypothetical protein